jgi:hypothetical protein
VIAFNSAAHNLSIANAKPPNDLFTVPNPAYGVSLNNLSTNNLSAK